jgi:hypothetical protein
MLLDHSAKIPRLFWADLHFTRVGYRSIFRKLESRLGVSLLTRLAREAAFIAKLPLALRYISPSFRELRTELRSREIFLNSKHRLAWANFLESDCDLLLVLEDDARPANHLWQAQLLESIKTAGELKSKPSIVNLAPFFDLEDLLPELTKHSHSFGQNWRSFHFYANTTAAYIINRLAAKELLTGFTYSPRYNLESIDFAMTRVALDTEIRVEYLERTRGVFQNLSQVEGDSSLGN